MKTGIALLPSLDERKIDEHNPVKDDEYKEGEGEDNPGDVVHVVAGVGLEVANHYFVGKFLEGHFL